LSKVIDITVTFDSDLPLWPGSVEYEHGWYKRIAEGDSCNNSYVKMDLHTGSHIDAPLHFMNGCDDVTAIDPAEMLGDCFVADMSGKDAKDIGPEHLASLPVPGNIKKILFKTKDETGYACGQKEFVEDYKALTSEGARGLVNAGFDLIGTDASSVESFDGNGSVHRLFLDNGIIVVEGLDLSVVGQGVYELICLPMKIRGAEASPVRALLKTKSGEKK
jgi:arylformamidase